MDTKDLELAVLDMIKNLYECEYVGKIKVKETKRGYLLELGLGKNDVPYTLAFDGNEECFLKYLKNELREANLHFPQYSELKKLYFTNGCCER